MRGVFVAAILIFALMVAVKDGRLMRKAGLSGGCAVIATESEETGVWQAARPGSSRARPT